MANMSYCRFQNTAEDLQDCVSVLDVWRRDARAALGLPDPSKPGLTDDIVF